MKIVHEWYDGLPATKRIIYFLVFILAPVLLLVHWVFGWAKFLLIIWIVYWAVTRMGWVVRKNKRA